MSDAQRRSARPSTGAVRADDGRTRKRRGLWWLWPLLALVLIGVLLLLFLLLRDGDDDNRASSAAKATPGATAPSSATPGAGAAGQAGTLTAGGASLLPVAGAGALGDTVGKAATGKNVTVQQIVPGQGLWVGSSAKDRIYVELGGDVGQDEQPAGDADLAVGDRVDLTGETRPAPEDPEQTLNLDRRSAEIVRSQGVFINASTVEPVR